MNPQCGLDVLLAQGTHAIVEFALVTCPNSHEPSLVQDYLTGG